MLTTIKHTESTHVVNLNGEFDALAAEDVRQAFSDLLENYAGDVVVDMTGVTFIDSSGIGAIVFLYKRLYATSRKLSIVGLNKQPQDMISLLRIDKTISTYQNMNDYMNQ